MSWHCRDCVLQRVREMFVVFAERHDRDLTDDVVRGMTPTEWLGALVTHAQNGNVFDVDGVRDPQEMAFALADIRTHVARYGLSWAEITTPEAS